MKIVLKIIFVLVFLVLGAMLAWEPSPSKTDFRSYADTCDSCYTKISHTHLHVSIPPQKTKTDSLKAYIRAHDSIRTVIKRQWVETAQEALDLAKKEGNHTQMFLFEEHLYIANRYRTMADRHLCDSAKLHYAEEMLQTAMQIEDADTIGIAITHYMDAMKRLGKEADLGKVLKGIEKIETVRESPYGYSKILCIIARKYSAEGDSVLAKKYLNRAMLIGIKGGGDGVEVVGRNAAQQLLAKGNVREAAQAYYSVLQMNDSVMKEKRSATKKQQEAEKVYIQYVVLWGILFLLVICGIGAFFYFRNKRKADELTFKSEITTLHETIARHESHLLELEKAETGNREEIAAQKKTIEKLKNTIVERLSRGKAIYEKLQNGNCMPEDIKGAEGYLIDYYVIFVPEKYNKWNEEFEGLTPRMYTYLILMDMNYSDADMQRLLNLSPSGLRALRSRTLAKKVQS